MVKILVVKRLNYYFIKDHKKNSCLFSLEMHDYGQFDLTLIISIELENAICTV